MYNYMYIQLPKYVFMAQENIFILFFCILFVAKVIILLVKTLARTET